MNQWVLLAGAGFVAGTMNAVAGGGSFVSLPVLIGVGVPSLPANASSTLALLPGSFASAFAYRRDLRSFTETPVWLLFAVSLVGALGGAFLLLSTPQRAFDAVLPWLLLIGSLTFAFGRQWGRWLRRRVAIGRGAAVTVQLVLGVYAGYFGGAVGIMMMAAWSLLGATDIAAINASRTLIVGSANVIAALVFIAGGLIWWPQTLVMLVAAIVGGYGGAVAMRRLDPERARLAIAALNFAITALFFWKTYGR